MVLIIERGRGGIRRSLRGPSAEPESMIASRLKQSFVCIPFFRCEAKQKLGHAYSFDGLESGPYCPVRMTACQLCLDPRGLKEHSPKHWPGKLISLSFHFLIK